MTIEINPSFVNRVFNKWDEAETTEVLDALRVELRRDLRKANRNDVPIFESIIEQMDSRDFWGMLDVVMGYKFNP
jgi:hypothetical protein